MSDFFRILSGRRRHARMALGVACLLLCLPAASFAAQGKGLVITPLGDDLGRGGDAAGTVTPAPERLPGETVPFFTRDGAAGQPGTPPGDAATGDVDTRSSGGVPTSAQSGELSGEPPSYKDGVIMAYLVELMRKQGKPCPSGAQPPPPPSLLFSEPLCRVAEAVGNGAEFPAAYEQQGLYAARWRMFSAADQPAQRVATRLREQHCEALLEPYTHIGAWRGNSGWRIVLATLTEKPEAVPATASQPASQIAPQTAPQPASGPLSGPASGPTPGQSPAPTAQKAAPVPATTPAVPPMPQTVPAAQTALPAQTAPVAPTAPRPDLPPLDGMAPQKPPSPLMPKLRSYQ